MSRLRHFLHSVASSYALLAVNALYTLAAIPLALKYLSKEGFGVWAVVSQIVMYLSLVDYGLTPSISRIIVDVKDKKSTGEYATVVSTSWLTQAGAGIIIVCIGLLLAPFLPGVFNVPLSLKQDFLLLAKWQIVLSGAMFLTRILEQMLTAHQHQYLTNYAQVAFFLSGYVTLFLSFARGLGLISMVIANGVAWVSSASIQALSCACLDLYPKARPRERFSLPVFRELFTLGRDTFLTVLGSQFIMASQVLIISRSLGLVAAATWAIATRPFFFAGQIVWRLFDSSLPALAEMMVRNEKLRLFDRFQALVRICGVTAVFAASLYAALNPSFLRIWTGGQIEWSRVNDILLAVWLVLLSIAHCHGMLIISTKRLHFMRYVYFLEGLCFVVSGSFACRHMGIWGMLICSIGCSALFHANYIYRRIAHFFDVSQSTVLFSWQKETAWAVVVFSVVGIPLNLIVSTMQPVPQFLTILLILVPVGILLLKRTVLDNAMLNWSFIRFP